jgi:hypothetical protein
MRLLIVIFLEQRENPDHHASQRRSQYANIKRLPANPCTNAVALTRVISRCDESTSTRKAIQDALKREECCLTDPDASL